MAVFAGPAFATVPYTGASAAGGGPGVTVNGGLYPQEVIEIAPGWLPFQANPVWVDITADVGDWETKRGRQHELGRFEAGQAKITIDNRGGPYYPFNTSAPPVGYSGQITPGMPVRIRGVYGSRVWPVFSGFIEAVRPKWKSINEGEIEFHCRDMLKYLNLKKVAGLSTYPATVAADAPTAYYRLNDTPSSVTAADSSGNGNTGTLTGITGTPAGFLGAAGLIVADGGTAFDCGARGVSSSPVGTNGMVNLPAGITFTDGADFSVECWITVRSIVGGDFIFSNGTGYPQQVKLTLDTGGFVRFTVTDGTHNNTAASLMSVSDGKPHHIVAIWQTSTHNTMLFIDGGQQFAQVTSPSPVFSVSSLNFGTFDGVLDEAAVYASDLSVTAGNASKAANHYTSAIGPLAGQASGARVVSLLGAAGVPAAVRAVDAGYSVLQAVDNATVTGSALTALTAVTDTEGGALFVDASGVVTFWDRTHTSRSPNNAVAVVLGEQFASGEEPYLVEGLDLARDDVDLYNKVAVTPLNQGTQTAANIAANDVERTLKLTNQLMSSPQEALDKATFLLSKYSTVYDRARAVAVTPMSDPNVLFPAALGFDLLARVELRRRPADSTGTVLDQVALVEGIEHKVTAGTWETIWRLSPTDATVVWIIDDPVAGKITGGASQSPPVVLSY